MSPALPDLLEPDSSFSSWRIVQAPQHVNHRKWIGSSKSRKALGVVVQPSARAMFTPHELIAAFKEFIERGPQFLGVEIGIRASAHQFGERVLLVYQESETDVVVLIHEVPSTTSLDPCSAVDSG